MGRSRIASATGVHRADVAAAPAECALKPIDSAPALKRPSSAAATIAIINAVLEGRDILTTAGVA